MTAPRMRAGDTDRQAVVDRLTTHFTEGRLDPNEYDDRVQKAYADMGVLDFAAANLDGLMNDDERTADELDNARNLARQHEVDETIAVGAEA